MGPPINPHNKPPGKMGKEKVREVGPKGRALAHPTSPEGLFLTHFPAFGLPAILSTARSEGRPRAACAGVVEDGGPKAYGGV